MEPVQLFVAVVSGGDAVTDRPGVGGGVARLQFPLYRQRRFCPARSGLRRLGAGGAIVLCAFAGTEFTAGHAGVQYMYRRQRHYEAFYQQMHTNGTNSRWTQTLNPLAILWTEVRERYLVAFGFITRGVSLLKGVALVAYVGAVAGCLANGRLRSQRPVRLLLLLLAVYFAALSVFNQKLSYYLIHIVPLYVSLLAVWIADGWEHNRRLRPVLAAGVLLLAGLDAGGIFLKAYTRSYRAEQQTMVAFVRANTAPESRIAGSAALLYSFDFDPRLKDDLYIGLRGSPQPDVLIVENLYRDAYEAWKKERPKILGRLDGYRLANRKAEYEVYLRRKEER